MFFFTLLAIIAKTNAYFTGDGTAYTLGSIGSGNCNFMYSGFTQASTNYAALNNEQWQELSHCGRCAAVKCIDSRCSNQESVIVQILDRCPECKYGDLDLSPSVFKTITGSDPSRYKIQWDFVPCPITGNIKYCFHKGANNYWLAVQPTNFATGIHKMKINGIETTMMQQAYYYILNNGWVDTTQVSIELIDINGYVISEKISLVPGQCSDSNMGFAPLTPTTAPPYPDDEDIPYC